MLGAAFGLAFVIGPPLGGTAADYDIHLPFVISFLECLLLYFALQFLPEPAKRGRASKKVDGGGGGGGGMAKSESAHLVAGIDGSGGAGGGGSAGAREGGDVIVDKARVVTSSSLGPSQSITRTRSSQLMALENGKGAAIAGRAFAVMRGAGVGGMGLEPATVAGGGGGGGSSGLGSPRGMTRTKSSQQMAAAENGKARAVFGEDLRVSIGEGRRSREGNSGGPGGGVAGGAGGGGGGGAPGLSNRSSPGRGRGKTLSVVGEGKAAAASSAAPAAAPPALASAGGGGGNAAGGGGGGGGGRLGMFRGPRGRQMRWGFHDRFFLILAESMYNTSFAPFLTTVLSFPASRVGFLLSFMGMVSALTNVFLVGGLTTRFGERVLMASSLVVQVRTRGGGAWGSFQRCDCLPAAVCACVGACLLWAV